MTIDVLIAIMLTAAAAVSVVALAASSPSFGATRIGFGLVLAGWFFIAVILGLTGILAPDRLGTPGLGVAVALPVLAIAFLTPRWPALRNAAFGIPLPVLIGVNALRVLGVFFVMLYAEGRLPAPFAPSAGWGDIFVGATALSVAFLAARRVSGWRPLAFIWNVIGFADLVNAISLGVMSATGSPLRIFTDGPDTSLMIALPMFLIPGFLVPLLMLTHLAVFARLWRADPARRSGSPSVAGAL
jgi:hypothetical protein